MDDPTAAKRIEAAAFECTMCGHCCEGKGGIVVSKKDLYRLCSHLHLDADEFERQWGERHGDKLHVRAGEKGVCVFFIDGAGCGVHEAKPDICRAWPYFRGNLVDSESHNLAKDFCPGISRECAHTEFVRQGVSCLIQEGLVGRGGRDEAGALQVADILMKNGASTP